MAGYRRWSQLIAVDPVLFQGRMGTKKKKKKSIDGRYFYMFEDRLSYYANETDPMEEIDPRGNLSFQDVDVIVPTTIEDEKGLTYEGIAFILYNGRGQLDVLEFGEPGRLQALLKALRDVFPGDKFLSNPEALEAMKERKEGRVDEPPKLLEIGSPIEEMQTRAQPSPSGLPASANSSPEIVLFQGWLYHKRKKDRTQRYARLLHDCFEYYTSPDEISPRPDDNEPRGRVVFTDFEAFLASDDGFDIKVRDKKKLVEFACMTAEDKAQWLAWFRIAFDAISASPPGAAATAPPKPSSPSSSKAAALQKEILCQGEADIVKSAKADRRYCILWGHQFEYYDSVDDFKARATVRCRVPLEQVKGFRFQETDDSFRLLSGEREITMRVADEKQRKAWAEAFERADLAILEHDDFRKLATEIMEVADNIASDGSLSIVEMQAFFQRGTAAGRRYGRFLDWIMSRGHLHFRHFDRDGDGTLTLEELEKAVKAFGLEAARQASHGRGIELTAAGARKAMDDKSAAVQIAQGGRSGPASPSMPHAEPEAAIKTKDLRPQRADNSQSVRSREAVTQRAVASSKVGSPRGDKSRSPSPRDHSSPDEPSTQSGARNAKPAAKGTTTAGKSPKVSPRSESGKAGVLLEGVLDLKTNNMESRYVVVFADGVHVYPTHTDFRIGADPRTMIAKEHIRSLSAKDKGFVLDVDSGKMQEEIEFYCKDKRGVDCWIVALGSILASGEPAPAVTNNLHQSDSRAPRPPGSRKVLRKAPGASRAAASKGALQTGLESPRGAVSAKSPRGSAEAGADDGVKLEPDAFLRDTPRPTASKSSLRSDEEAPQTVATKLFHGDPDVKRPAITKKLFQADVTIGSHRQAMKRHAALSADGCFELHSSRNDLQKGKDALLVVTSADIDRVVYHDTDRCFAIQSTDKTILMHVSPLDAAAWRQVFHDSIGDRLVSGPMPVMTPRKDGRQDAPPKARNGENVQQGFVEPASRGTTTASSRGTSPHSRAPASPRSAASASRSPRGRSQEPSVDSMYPDPSEAIFRPPEILRPPGVFQLPETPRRMVRQSRWPTAELANPSLLEWLKQLRVRDPYLMHGLLGVQPKDQLVIGYFVLFRDRLDFWNRPVEAAAGARPRGRIMLSEVRGLETVSSGFILNYKGRKIGLHVDSNESLHDWSQALLQVLAPTAADQRQATTPPRSPRDIQRGGTAMHRSRSSPGPRGRSEMKLHLPHELIERMRQQLIICMQGLPANEVVSRLDRKRAGRLTAKELGAAIKDAASKAKADVIVSAQDVEAFVCAMDVDGSGHVKTERLVQFYDRGATGTGPIKRRGKMPSTWVPRVALLAGKSQSRAFIDPEEEALNATRQAGIRKRSIFRSRSCGVGMSVQTCKVRRSGGFAWKAKCVAGKVNIPNPEDDPSGPLDRKRIPVAEQADQKATTKITGGAQDRQIVLSKGPGHLEWAKINHHSQDTNADPELMQRERKFEEREMPRKVGEEDRQARQARACLTDKITDRDRKPFACCPNKENSGPQGLVPTGKLTDAARTCSGWAQPFNESIYDRHRDLYSNVKARNLTPRSRSQGSSPTRSQVRRWSYSHEEHFD